MEWNREDWDETVLFGQLGISIWRRRRRLVSGKYHTHRSMMFQVRELRK